MKAHLRFVICSVIISLFATGTVFAQSAKLVNLSESSAQAGMTLYWDPLALCGILEQNGHQIAFQAGDDFVLEDYTHIRQVDAPVVQNGTLMVTQAFLSSAENFIKTESSASQYRIGAILIDPGHGGKDPGANATYTVGGKKVTVNEKDVNLNVALLLYDRLKKAYPDKRILMTRSTDVFLSLEQRTEIANSVKLAANEAILYVSVHVNASLDKKATGYEVWYLNPGYRRQVLNEDLSGDSTVNSILNDMMEEEFTTESMLIANFILDGIGAQVGNLSNSRGIKAEEWFVVRNVNMPSVLIETGFLTNEKEALLLVDETYLQKLSLGIYNGLAAFVTHFERSRGFTGM